MGMNINITNCGGKVLKIDSIEGGTIDLSGDEIEIKGKSVLKNDDKILIINKGKSIKL
ncbi:MAG: hypothetical protein PHH27_00145 [Candidatus Colwellbacteria bacterium]|jgi:hypothetical protein|nr:hypothetical protein [Candidatus Colwellbacteria bacterium]MDD4818596.1 hypothetical protein [Candidatus Colwellbacteria bacterium]